MIEENCTLNIIRREDSLDWRVPVEKVSIQKLKHIVEQINQ